MCEYEKNTLQTPNSHTHTQTYRLIWCVCGVSPLPRNCSEKLIARKTQKKFGAPNGFPMVRNILWTIVFKYRQQAINFSIFDASYCSEFGKKSSFSYEKRSQLQIFFWDFFQILNLGNSKCFAARGASSQWRSSCGHIMSIKWIFVLN